MTVNGPLMMGISVNRDDFGRLETHDARAAGEHVSLDHITRHKVDASGVPPLVIAGMDEPPVRGFAACGVGLHTANVNVAARFVEEGRKR